LWFAALVALVQGRLNGQDVRPSDLVVRELAFSGNRAIDDATLRMSISTTQSSAFARLPVVRWIGLGAKKYFNETEFRRDVLRILFLYGRTGFREVRVDTLVQRTDVDVYVRFIIDEGEPVRVDSLSLVGVDGIVDSDRVVGDLPLRVGDPFSLLMLQASVDSIQTILGNKGYPFPEVFQSFDVDLEDHAAQVFWDVVPGEPALFGNVVVSGSEEIDESVVRRALAFKPGQPFSEEKLRRSQADLYRMNLFNFVGIGLADSLRSSDGSPSLDVEVRVAEASLRRLRLGGGYGTFDCFRGLGAWTIYDFLGGGRTLDLSAQFSKVGVGEPLDLGLQEGICLGLRDEDTSRLKLNYNLSVGVSEPFFLSRNTSAGITFGAERYTEFQAYLREQVGGELSFTWRTQPELPVTLSYSLSRSKTEADEATFCTYLDLCLVDDIGAFTERRTRSMLGFGFVWDRSDSRASATRGRRFTADVRYASSSIGSDSLIQFTRGVAEFASYHRVARRGVFAWRLRLGAVTTHKGIDFISPEDRLYGGGPNSVRGFAQNELGPLVRVLDRIEGTGGGIDSVIRRSATGGDRLVLASAEIRVPLPGFADRVSGALFVDAGQVIEHTQSDERLTDLKVTPGLGFRIATAIGPMRLDVGFNPYDPRPGLLYEYNEGRTELLPVAEDCGEAVCVPLDYAPQVESFLGRLRLHFSVGQAF
jgi:outer membrane protein insertion porin family/translocation and assembly module TamA